MKMVLHAPGRSRLRRATIAASTTISATLPISDGCRLNSPIWIQRVEPRAAEKPSTTIMPTSVTP